MLRGLFARLTGAPRRGQALFDATVTEARRVHWFEQGEVPDTLEGRFAMLSTVAALLIVRLEQEDAPGEAASVALTERFVEAMDAEIRQMGVGDPALGKQVRALVGALGARVGHWRATIARDGGWRETILRSLYRDRHPADEALAHSEAALRELWSRIAASAMDELSEGRIG